MAMDTSAVKTVHPTTVKWAAAIIWFLGVMCVSWFFFHILGPLIEDVGVHVKGEMNVIKNATIKP